MPFYLTEGTALSRGDFNHRYSDDINLFVNDDSNFSENVNAVINALEKAGFDIEYNKNSSPTYRQIFINKNKDNIDEKGLKIDFVNDIPSHFGDITQTSIYYRTDSLRNILSNKYTALYRMSPKDVVDMCQIAKTLDFDWKDLIQEAEEKETGINIKDIVQILNSTTQRDLCSIKWTKSMIDIDAIQKDINTIAKDVLRQQHNSLFNSRTAIRKHKYINNGYNR